LIRNVRGVDSSGVALRWPARLRPGRGSDQFAADAGDLRRNRLICTGRIEKVDCVAE
jgi:hypothetical protein